MGQVTKHNFVETAWKSSWERQFGEINAGGWIFWFPFWRVFRRFLKSILPCPSVWSKQYTGQFAQDYAHLYFSWTAFIRHNDTKNEFLMGCVFRTLQKQSVFLHPTCRNTNTVIKSIFHPTQIALCIDFTFKLNFFAKSKISMFHRTCTLYRHNP